MTPEDQASHPADPPEDSAPGLRLPLPLARPRWTWLFLVANVAIFFAMEAAGGSTRTAVLVAFGANYAPFVAKGEYWRLLTANFLHIGVMHLAVNSYTLYVLGQEVEALFAHARFVVIYLLTGVSGAVFSFMMTQGLSAGASTALFGLFGALVAYFFRQRSILGTLGRQRLVSLGLTLSINVMIGLGPGSRIDNWGHLGGLIGGLALGWALCPRYTVVERPVVGPAGLQPASLVDTNSLGKQAVAIGLFTVGLVVLTAIAQMAQH